jgi:hypothetical protein
VLGDRYAFLARSHDPQTGRFGGVDPVHRSQLAAAGPADHPAGVLLGLNSASALCADSRSKRPSADPKWTLSRGIRHVHRDRHRQGAINQAKV